VAEQPPGGEADRVGFLIPHHFNTIMVEEIAVAVGMAAIFLWLGSRVFVQENA
jgi:hypothetical protein